jgi:hypothetical protein
MTSPEDWVLMVPMARTINAVIRHRVARALAQCGELPDPGELEDPAARSLDAFLRSVADCDAGDVASAKGGAT